MTNDYMNVKLRQFNACRGKACGLLMDGDPLIVPSCSVVRRGITLLMLLLVLVVLASVIVVFQSDAAVQIRSSQHRLDRQQCRYAAESGFVIGAELVRQYLREPLAVVPEAVPADAEIPEEGLTDPNQLPEPNSFGEEAFILPELEEEALPTFVLMRRKIKVAEAVVEIEIHDENAKWPMFWLLSSPFDADKAYANSEKAFLDFSNKLEVGSSDAKVVGRRARELSRNLKIPQAPLQVSKKARAQNISRRGRRLKYADKIAAYKDRYAIMGCFASIWHNNRKDDEDLEFLEEPLAEMPGTVSDYLSMWGTNMINLNTASDELLEAAFKGFGLNAKQVESIIGYRTQQPFRNTGNLNDVGGMSIETINNVRGLCVVRSDTFSVYVKARVGRIEYRLVGGVYSDFDFKLQKSAVFSGDS